MTREIRYAQAIHEALDLCLAKDPSVYLMGLGVPDPKGIFGTTLGLQEKYGAERVMDMPTAENGMTGVAVGSALVGMRPVMVHQRMDFAVLAMEQIVNQAAKWHYMFGAKARVPLTIRLLVGRGWGQGTQHSQSLQSWFAHIPGLKVVMPATAADAKGLLVSAIEDDNPVIFIEHRWLHNVKGPVPTGVTREPIGKARVVRAGTDVTLVGVSYMTLECIRAAEYLAEDGISAEVIDLRSVRPLDRDTLLASVRKTGRLVMADTGWALAGISAEILALASEHAFDALKAAPARLTLPDCPIPSTPGLAKHCYPHANDIAAAAARQVGRPFKPRPLPEKLDIPDASFTGPF
ncbi:MAG: alpha-ketoacid dehydrogenase subunit beta [Elusimicrobia bacterium]|nr:alpha-ketoacid dehydrogenase subunit beta [Elusimicrobiota bacterium]